MNTNKLNFIFFGTPDVASETLEILKQSGYLPALIVTSPDAKSGRGLKTQASPVAIFAEKNNIQCLKPEKLDAEFYNKLKSIGYRLSIVVAYGKIIPKNILEIPELGSINIHYSSLPKYRGASPVESAILNGDTETGVTIQQMEYKMDSGPIIAHEKVLIIRNEKTPDLRARLIKIGAELLVKNLPKIESGNIEKISQNEQEATYCGKIKKEDGLINLEKEEQVVLYNKFRAYAHWPRIFFFKNNKRVIISDAELVDNKLLIKRVLPEGKKEMNYEEFIKTNP